MINTIIDEANRCLHCRVPQCTKGCPIATSIPQVLDLLLANEIDEAGMTLFENNPLSLICSLICNHEKQCEGNCVLGKKGAPINFSLIENYISGLYLDKFATPSIQPNNKKVGIIGAGPAGITIAIILAKKGYAVTLFESKDRIGGVLQYGIPEFRLPKKILARYLEILVKLGVKVRPNIVIGETLTVDDLFNDGYQSVFAGTGVWKPRKLGVPGESFGQVHYAIDYLSSPEAFVLGDKVAILGMGNSAMDVARTAIRQGAREVTLIARKDRAAASAKEVMYAHLDGAKFKYCQKVIEITQRGVVLDHIEIDESGVVTGLAHQPELYEVDSVIIAISQGPKDRLTSTTPNLEANEQGLLITDETGKTTRQGLFAAGDVVYGAKTVVEAVNNAKKVAQQMDEYMMALE